MHKTNIVTLPVWTVDFDNLVPTQVSPEPNNFPTRFDEEEIINVQV